MFPERNCIIYGNKTFYLFAKMKEVNAVVGAAIPLQINIEAAKKEQLSKRFLILPGKHF